MINAYTDCPTEGLKNYFTPLCVLNHTLPSYHPTNVDHTYCKHKKKECLYCMTYLEQDKCPMGSGYNATRHD